MHPIIESVSDAWKTVPLSTLPVSHDITGARWLCRGGSRAQPYVSPKLKDVSVISLVLRAFNVHCWVDGETFYDGKVAANRLRIVPAGDVPSWTTSGLVEMFHIYVPDIVLRRNLSLLGYQSDATPVLLRQTKYVSDPLLQNLMQRLSVTVRLDGKLQEKYIGTISDALVLHLLNHYGDAASRKTVGPDPRQIAMTSAIEKIKACLGEHTDVRTLAGETGLSVSQFTRNFHKATGLTPHQYRLRLRIEAARERLATGTASLAEIADELGFADQAHFTRAFKQFDGMTPGEFMAKRTASEW